MASNISPAGPAGGSTKEEATTSAGGGSPATPESLFSASRFSPTSIFNQSAFIPDKVANVQFDIDGDVVLLLRNSRGTARFQVNSSILCMTSPVFRAMLGVRSHFKEGKELASRGPGMAPVEVNIEDDDPDVFAVILQILHHRHNSVPKVIAGDKLYQVAILCDKYDLQQALSLSLDKWIPTPSVILSESMTSQDDKRLFMAYVFRMEEEFRIVSRDLILTYRGGVGIFGRTLQFKNIPQTIVDEIMATRSTAIAAIVSCVRRWVASYDDPTRFQCQYRHECCDAFALGHLTREFKQKGLYPTISTHVQSVKEIRDRIASLGRPKFAYFDNLGGSRNHASCLPISSIVAEVTAIVDAIEGLQYSRFVRKKQDGRNNGANVGANANLWDCLKYI